MTLRRDTWLMPFVVAAAFFLSFSCKEQTERSQLTGKPMDYQGRSASQSSDAFGEQNAVVSSAGDQQGTVTAQSTANTPNGANDDRLNGLPDDPDNTSEDDNDFTPEGDRGPGEFKDNYRTSSKFFTRMGGPVKGNSPHGTVQIWYSDNIEEMVDRPNFTVPEGTVAIKSFKNDDGEGIVVMIKQEDGYDRENGDWRYEMRDKSGQLLDDPKPGKIGMCIACHAAAEDTDFLAGTNFGLAADDETPPPVNSGDAENGPGKFVADFKTSDDFFTETQEAYKGNSPHGDVRIWYSSNIANLIGNAKFIAPVGTVAIKEFDNDQDDGVDGVAVMIKQPTGFDPENNDWHYEMRDQWGTLKTKPAPGKNGDCSACHAAAADTDYLPGTKISTGDVPDDGEGPGKFKSDYYSSPLFFTNMSKMHTGKSPHGSTRIWYSSNIESLMGKDEFKVPVGTVAIKRFENNDKQGIAVMIKQAVGYDPLNGDWRYEMRDRYGNLLQDPKPGKIEMCSKCHASFEKRDYLGGTRLNN